MKLNRIYTWLRHPGESLSQRVVHAGFWAFALRFVSRLFGLARTIVLARLLAPNDFGLYGIALLSLSALETFSRTGFDQALIQKKEDTKSYLDTAWTVQVIRGFVLTIILVLGAPLVGSFFGEPRAVLLVQVLGAAVFLKNLGNIGIVYFKKELEFHKQFIYEFSGTFADLAVAIPAAFILRSVWALVFGLLAGNLVRMVVSYFIHPYRPRLRLEGAKAKELYTFGRWIFGSSILLFLLNQGDDILVGKTLGVAALGFYQLAYRLSNLPATEITCIVSQVTFPVYSKLQNNLEKLREAYLKTLQLTAFISIPLAGMIAILVPDFTKIFLGEKWMPMVPATQMLAVWGLIRSIGATTGPVFQAVGRPDILTKLVFCKLLCLAALIYPMTQAWGILGTALAVVLSAAINNPIADYMVIRVIRCPIRDFLKSLVYPLIGTLLMLSSMFIFRRGFNLIVGLDFFILSAVTGLTIYFLVMVAFHKIFNYRIITMFQEVFR